MRRAESLQTPGLEYRSTKGGFDGLIGCKVFYKVVLSGMVDFGLIRREVQTSPVPPKKLPWIIRARTGDTKTREPKT